MFNKSNEHNIKFMKEISNTYITVNNGTDTLLQLTGCISRIVSKINY